jgi:hypothetical protein
VRTIVHFGGSGARLATRSMPSASKARRTWPISSVALPFSSDEIHCRETPAARATSLCFSRR